MGTGNEDIRLTLGTLLVGSLLNTYLFGIVAHQFWVYYTSKFNDALWIRFTVLGLLVNDGVHSALIIYIPWYYLISVDHDEKALAYPVLPYLINPLFETTAAVLTHVFLIHRLYHLNRCKRLRDLLLVLVLLESVASLYVGAGPIYFDVNSMTHVHEFKYFYILWFALQISVDVILSTSLAWQFYAFKDSEASRVSRSKTVLVRLTRKAIQTGIFATVFAIASAMTQFYWKDTGNLAAAFALPLGRIYTNAIMDTLLMRKDLRGIFIGAEHKLTDIVAQGLGGLHNSRDISQLSSTDLGEKDLERCAGLRMMTAGI